MSIKEWLAVRQKIRILVITSFANAG